MSNDVDVLAVEFTIYPHGILGVGVKVERTDETTLLLSIGKSEAYGGEIRLNQSEALSLAGALKSVAKNLEPR